MDLAKTGKFIAERRKAKGLTQAKLAEMLFVSEKTISKWECGNGFPDTTLILPLCKALDITANELLSAKLLSSEEYKTQAEQNLITLKAAHQKCTKQLLLLEWVIGLGSSIGMMLMIFTASFFVQNTAWRIVLIVLGFVLFLTGVIFAVKIEADAGYYECAACHHRYAPPFKSVLLSMHYGRTRYMKCPKCGKCTWQTKTLDE